MLYGREHVERYEATDGAEGYIWRNNTTILLLHSRGRKTGKDVTSPLIYREYGDKFLIVASKGGSPEQPDWYRNLQADPDVWVQVEGDKIAVTARDATPDEKPGMWQHMTEAWPAYDEYQRKTDREIPVVVLERA